MSLGLEEAHVVQKPQRWSEKKGSGQTRVITHAGSPFIEFYPACPQQPVTQPINLLASKQKTQGTSTSDQIAIQRDTRIDGPAQESWIGAREPETARERTRLTEEDMRTVDTRETPPKLRHYHGRLASPNLRQAFTVVPSVGTRSNSIPSTLWFFSFIATAVQ